MATVGEVQFTGISNFSVTVGSTEPTPSLPAGAEGDRLYVFVACWGTGTFSCAGYATLLNHGIVDEMGGKVFSKVRGASESAPVLTKTGGAGGDFNAAFCFSIRDAKALDINHVTGIQHAQSIDIGPITVPTEDDVDDGGGAVVCAIKKTITGVETGTFSETKGNLAWVEKLDGATTVGSNGMIGQCSFAPNPLAGFGGKVGFGEGTFNLSGSGEREWLAFYLNFEANTLGIANSTLGSVAQSASGAETIQGAAASTLGSVAQSASGAEAMSGAAASTLGDVAQSASGTSELPSASGTMASTLGAFVQAAAGNNDSPVMEGAATSTLGDVAQSASGAEAMQGAMASTLGDVVQNASDTSTGEMHSTLDSVVQDAQGELDVITGTMGSVMGDVAQVALGRTPRNQDFCCPNSDPMFPCGQQPVIARLISRCVKVNQDDRTRRRLKPNKAPRTST